MPPETPEAESHAAGTGTAEVSGPLSAERRVLERRLLCALAVMLAAALLAAAGYLYPYLWAHPRLARYFTQPCLLKAQTGVPCPFCGATRSTVAAAHGEFVKSLRLSPLGIPLVFACGAMILWLGACAVTGRDLGLEAAGRLMSRAPLLRLVFLGVGGVWLYKLITDCLLGWNPR